MSDKHAMIDLAEWLCSEQARFTSSIACNDPAVKSHIATLKIWETAARATAPSPHPRGEPVAWQTAKVSIDVSTCDADAGRRVFGRVVDWQPEDYDGEKPLGLRLLCEYESDNFGLRAAPPPAGADAVREALEPFARISLWRDVYPDAKEDFLTARQLTGFINVADVRRARAVLALLPAPQPQEKSTGDQT